MDTVKITMESAPTLNTKDVKAYGNGKMKTLALASLGSKSHNIL